MKRIAVALAATLSLTAAAEPERSPEINYMLHCQGCHRPDGSGAPGAVPDLRSHVAVFLGSSAGRAFLVRVPGSANAPISDAELAELLVWIVNRFDPAHVPADFAPYDAAEVGRLRAQTLSKVRDERAAILTALEFKATDPAASPPPGSARPDAAGASDRRSP